MKGSISLIFAIIFILIKVSNELGIFEAPFLQFPSYGNPSNDSIAFPSYDERVMLMLLNIARVDPSYYRTTYYIPFIIDSTVSSSFLVANNPSVNPVYWNYNLNRLTRAHTDDAINCVHYTLSVDDCNSTTYQNRTNNYFGPTSILYEIFAYSSGVNQCFNGYGKRFWPVGAITLNLCDGNSASCNGFINCANDTVNGVRKAMMNSTVRQGGIGNTWLLNNATTDIVLVSNSTPYTTPPKIVSASHLFNNGNITNSYLYHAVIYAPNVTVNSVQVVINGVPVNLNLSSTSTSSKGVYYSSNYTFTDGVCSGYYFLINFNNTFSEKYPPNGEFKIFAYNSSCLQDWSSNVTTTPPPSTLIPSTLPPSTLTPTTLIPSTLTPSTLTPSVLTPSTLTPSTLTPSTLTPSVFTPSTLTPSTLTPSTLTPSTSLPSTLIPSTKTPSTRVPSTVQATIPCPYFVPNCANCPKTAILVDLNIFNVSCIFLESSWSWVFESKNSSTFVSDNSIVLDNNATTYIVGNFNQTSSGTLSVIVSPEKASSLNVTGCVTIEGKISIVLDGQLKTGNYTYYLIKYNCTQTTNVSNSQVQINANYKDSKCDNYSPTVNNNQNSLSVSLSSVNKGCGGGIPLGAIIGIVVGGSALSVLVAVTIGCIIYRRKKRFASQIDIASQEMKKM